MHNISLYFIIYINYWLYVQITVLVLKGTSNKTIKRVNLQSFVCSELDGKSAPPAYMVYAGLEPLAFTNLFPFWTCEESVREINLRVNGIFFSVKMYMCVRWTGNFLSVMLNIVHMFLFNFGGCLIQFWCILLQLDIGTS